MEFKARPIRFPTAGAAMIGCFVVHLAFPGSAAGAAAEPPAGAFSGHVAELRKRAGADFTVVPQPPFVVIGDEAPALVRRHATNTVQWAVDRLKQEYFERNPTEIIDIWLFRDHASYTSHARTLFGDTPTTPFGYYSSEHHALIMNISTGGGTLVHEIVHPFMRANFPECPPWFNEGLASLYEQSVERNGRIRGRINWRLKGLEQSIQARETISFQKLMAMNDAQFYGEAGGRYNQHYAQARYLCYYLQEKNLLKPFYHQFVARAKQDPSGFQTLKRVLGESDMNAFKTKWEKFVLKLRSP
jgi:hypothetical protein